MDEIKLVMKYHPLHYGLRILLVCVACMAGLSGCSVETSTQQISEAVELTATPEPTAEAYTAKPEPTRTPTPEPTLTPVPEPEGQPSLLEFLKTACLPVGQTMYVWGGGWNEEDREQA